MIARHAITLDDNRPTPSSARRKTNQRTARENIAELVDHGSFIEYGALAIAAQRRRRTLDDLIRNTPADGLIAGVGTVNADTFGAEAARCMVLAYDYTVLAGTQGHMNHKKIDRMLTLAEEWRIAVVLYAEGGGGRPGRHRPARPHRARRTVLRAVREALGPGAGRRHRLRLLLCRQCRAARLLRRDHRDRRTPRSAWAARP